MTKEATNLQQFLKANYEVMEKQMSVC
jgi:hypothetical protein